MNRTHKQWSAIVALAVLLAAGSGWAQGPGAGFEIRTIAQRTLRAPNYGTSSGELGGAGPTLSKDWLRVEVRFDSRPDWADDVTVKYFVLMGQGREQRMFTGELTHVNLARGTHYSAMFMHPNTVKRFGDGRVTAVAVQVFHQNRLVGQKSDPATDERWWEQFSPVAGYLLSPSETPWAPIAADRYEAIKAR